MINIGFQVTEAEKRAVREYAARILGTGMSEYIRLRLFTDNVPPIFLPEQSIVMDKTECVEGKGDHFSDLSSRPATANTDPV